MARDPFRISEFVGPHEGGDHVGADPEGGGAVEPGDPHGSGLLQKKRIAGEQDKDACTEREIDEVQHIVSNAR
jgi:hypothetical protein